MNHILRIALFSFLVAVADVANAANISGTYVGIYSNASELLQIVERPDGSILGHFEQVMLSSDGTKTTTMNADVSGAVSGNTIVLTLKPAEILGGTIPLSGSIDGDTLRLSGGSNGNSVSVVARKSTQDLFDKNAQQLINQANKTKFIQDTIKKNEKLRQEVVRLTKWLKNYSQLAATHLQKLPNTPKYFASVTAKMQAALEKEKSLPAGSYARGQVDYFIGTLDYKFNSIHFDLQSVETSFGYSDGKIKNAGVPSAVLNAQSYCNDDPDKQDLVCDSFHAAYASYQDTVKQLEPMLTAAEAAWHSEHEKQKSIEKQADALSK